MNLETLKADLTRDEGLRLKAYRDSVGKWTIGVGHNLDDLAISPEAASLILEDDIQTVTVDLDRNIPWWRELSEARQRALVNMAFNLGWSRLSGFKQMLKALEDGDYVTASHEAFNSTWSGQVGNRAQRICKLIVEG